MRIVNSILIKIESIPSNLVNMESPKKPAAQNNFELFPLDILNNTYTEHLIKLGHIKKPPQNQDLQVLKLVPTST